MFDFFEMLAFGRRIRAHEEDWSSLKSFCDGWHLAVKPDATAPCVVYLVKAEEPCGNGQKGKREP